MDQPLMNRFYALVAIVNSYGYEKAIHRNFRNWPEFRRAYTNHQAALDELAELDKETR